MSINTSEESDNVLFKKLRKLINLIDQLRDCGVNEYIKLPRICSLGTQSSGKSSVLAFMSYKFRRTMGNFRRKKRYKIYRLYKSQRNNRRINR